MEMKQVRSDCPELPLELYSVLSVDVILRKLETFLAWEDLKNLRATSQEFSKLVLHNTKLLQKSKLVLTESVILDPSFQDLQFFPENLEIFPFRTKNSWNDPKLIKIMVFVCKLVEVAKSLKVWNLNRDDLPVQYRARFGIFQNDGALMSEDLDGVHVPEHCPNTLQILYSASNLKELVFEQGAEFLLSKAQEEDSSCLCNLQILRITNLWKVYVPRIFLGLRRLKVLEYKNLCGKHCNCQIEQHLRLQQVVEKNMETLKELGQLQPWFFKETATSDLGSRNFRLRKLQNHPMHEELDLLTEVKFFEKKFHGKLEAVSLFNPTADGIKTIFRFQESLRRLELSAVVMTESWFLETLRLIQKMALVSMDLSLIALQDSEEAQAPIDLLAYLPPSLQSLKIHLQGSSSDWKRIVFKPTSLKDLYKMSSFSLLANGFESSHV